MIISAEARRSADIFAARALTEISTLLAATLPPGALEEFSVSTRIKSEESILAKASRRPDYSVVNDFIGIRVVVLHVGLLAGAVELVKKWAVGSKLEMQEYENRFQSPGLAMYRSVHLDFKFAQPESVKLTSACGIEFQITTFLQRFHEVFSHALFYKNYGDTSQQMIGSLSSLSERLAAIDQSASQLLPAEPPPPIKSY